MTLAVVMSGGGARAAYQVGVLRELSRALPHLQPKVICGASAGAINAAYLAAHTGPFAERVEGLYHLWRNVEIDKIFKVNVTNLVSHVMRWSGRLITGGTAVTPQVRGLVDNGPLWELVLNALDCRDPYAPIPGIGRNLSSGALRAVAIATTSYSTGQTINWIQGHDVPVWERPNRRGLRARLTPAHVMASAALPLFFPAVKVGGLWHGDGDMRMSAPLSPAVHLGATAILAISTRYTRSAQEASVPQCQGYPPPAQIIGVLMNAMFLDFLDQDALRLERVNRLLERVPEDQRDGLRLVKLAMMRPACDLGRLANEYEEHLPKAFRYLTRGLGTRELGSNDALSMVMFQSEYVRRLLDQGERDAEARVDEVRALLASRAPAAHAQLAEVAEGP